MCMDVCIFEEKEREDRAERCNDERGERAATQAAREIEREGKMERGGEAVCRGKRDL